MAFRLRPDEPVERGIKRIAREQIELALVETADDQLDRHEAVHQVRKRCKKIRGLLRLVRPALPDVYRQENACIRDAARMLSGLRDAESAIEAFDRFTTRISDRVDPEVVATARHDLLLRREFLTDERFDLEARLADFALKMQTVLDRVESWSCTHRGFAAIKDGFKKTYRLGRRSMSRAYKKGSAKEFHEWRKRTKDHWYHVRLLRDAWKENFKKRVKLLNRLSELLGDDHDMFVLRQILLEHPERFGELARQEPLIESLDRRRAEQQAQAKELGDRIYADNPKEFTRRLRKHWES